MPIAIQPYTEDFIVAVKEFNRRLKSAGCFSDFLFFEQHLSVLPKVEHRNLYEEYFLALEGSVVRGGFAVKHQRFSFFGELKPIAFYHFPLSEGIVDKKYTNVGVHMLQNALRDYPLVFALGMGGFDQPLPRMLKALGWSMSLVPFYFKVLRPFRFLRGMTELRRSVARRLFVDMAAYTGAGSIAIRILQGLTSKSRKNPVQPLEVEEISEFGDWADIVWKSSKSRYAMIGERTRETLNLLYPAEGKKFARLKVTSGGHPIGWLVLLDTQMSNNRHFGNLRVASIVDCLAEPENATEVIGAGTQFLQEKNIDLIVSNQANSRWGVALGNSGFHRATSNFVFAVSPRLAELLQPFTEKVSHTHFNRGDGDGPIRL